MNTQPPLLIDDCNSGTLVACNGQRWRVFTDQVMGGISTAQLTAATINGKRCISLSGNVRLENNGGFVQASLDLGEPQVLDARKYSGIEIEVLGNKEPYNLHLRTTDTSIVWQSYRASFEALPHWSSIWLPFCEFQPHRIDRPLDCSQLRRIGLVCIGKETEAKISIARLALR